MHRLVGLGLAASLALVSPSFSADLNQRIVQAHCAVSAPNGKIAGAGGSVHVDDDNEGGRSFLAASLTLPLDCEFGLQIDGTIGKLDDDTYGGVAGHFFTRDPNSHLIGLYGDFTDDGRNDIAHIGLEGELYNGQFTLLGIAGWEHNDIKDSGFFGVGQLSFYLTDDFVISGGITHSNDRTYATFGTEWQPAGSNISFFALGAAGEEDYSSIVGGVRLYFGVGQKSLIRRHREDDPINWQNILTNGTGKDEENVGIQCARDQFPIISNRTGEVVGCSDQEN